MICDPLDERIRGSKECFVVFRYELLEPPDQDGNHRADGTPPPLPARQNYQAVTPSKSGQKKDKSHYVSAKQLAESSKHREHSHEHYASSKVIQENARHENYQRQLENAHRGQDGHVTTSYVKMQKERYEIKQDNLYASQRELHKNDAQHHGGHQKLTASNSLPLAHNAIYSLPKSGSNNNIGRYEYEQPGKYDYETPTKPDRNSKYELQEEKIERSAGKYEHDVRAHEKRIGYEYTEDIYERRNNKYEADLMKYEMECQRECQHNNERKHGNDAVEHNRDSMKYEMQHDFKVGEKVTCLKTSMSERPVPHKVSVEYRQSKDFPASLPPEVRISDVNCPEVAALPSEDELSNGSGSVSPRLRRANKHRGGNRTPSSGSSRNQSPRPKPGVRNSAHRNSANLTSSTLQEDLMRLINPDYIADDNQIINNNLVNSVMSPNQNSNKMNNNMLEIQNRCRSRENLCGNSASTLSVLPANGQENGNNGSEVILTMARPATVISNASTASSPAPSENKLSKEER